MVKLNFLARLPNHYNFNKNYIDFVLIAEKRHKIDYFIWEIKPGLYWVLISVSDESENPVRSMAILQQGKFVLPIQCKHTIFDMNEL